MITNKTQIMKGKTSVTSKFTAHFPNTRKCAFTLAEVLITLAVIGIVAALTIPALISKHNKTVVVQKLKKASSVLQQAYNLSIADYENVEREGFEPFNPDAALEMFNKYYVPYIKFDKVEKGTKGVFGYMLDDTALYFIKNSTPENWTNTYIIVCTSHTACKNIDEEAIPFELTGLANGKDRFGFYTNGKVPTWALVNWTREQRLNSCASGGIESCTDLIWEAGWQIPKDYPIKF